MPKDDALLTNEKAAAILKVKPATLIAWRHRGIGPAYIRLGKRVFYRPETISTFIRSLEQNPRRRSQREERDRETRQ